MFKKIDEDEALMQINGVYKPVELYELNGCLFAAVAGGFVRLKGNGSTSMPKMKVITLLREGPLFQDTFGRLCVEGGEGRREVMLTNTGEISGVADIASLPTPETKK